MGSRDLDHLSARLQGGSLETDTQWHRCPQKRSGASGTGGHLDRVGKVDKEDSGHSGQGVATRRWAGVPDQVVPWGSRRGDLNEHGKWE